MNIPTHFRSLEDLIRALDREQVLLKEMFYNRKTLSFKYAVARELAKKKDDQEGIIRMAKHYEVVCGVIVNEGEVLCMQRPFRGSSSTAGKWEFPGGKIEPGESPEEALTRELREEMDYEVSVVKEIMTVNHEYPDFSLSLRAFLCEVQTRTFNRKEHIDHRWLSPTSLSTLDWAEADLALINFLVKEWGNLAI